jgi:hypothetical protein
MASRHCTAKLSASKASSANQKVGTDVFIYLCAIKIVKGILL